MMKRMVVISRDQGLFPVSLSRMMRTTTMSTETEAHLPKAWGMMRWAEHLNKFLGILRDNLVLRLIRWLTLCSENQCIKSWRRSRTSPTSNGQTKWEEIPWGATRASITNTTKSRGIPPRIAELFRTIWNNWSGKEGYSSFCISLTDKETNWGQGRRGMLLKAPVRHN